MKNRAVSAQTRFDTVKRLPKLLRTVEEIAEKWDEPDDSAADAADLLTGLVQAWREFSLA